MNLIEGVYNAKNILLLEIGRSDAILFAIDTMKLQETDRELIKNNKELLHNMDSRNRYDWIKQNCASLKGAYKTYKLEKLQVSKVHDL